MKTLQDYRAESTLKKIFRYDEGVMTRQEWIELKLAEGCTVKQETKAGAEWDRRKFNNMDGYQQREYEKKLDSRIPCYNLYLPSGSFYEITKAEFDYFNFLIQNPQQN
jgi:hypothetical protein